MENISEENERLTKEVRFWKNKAYYLQGHLEVIRQLRSHEWDAVWKTLLKNDDCKVGKKDGCKTGKKG